MNEERESLTEARVRTVRAGPLWHMAALVLCALVAGRARAQAPSEGSASEDPVDAQAPGSAEGAAAEVGASESADGSDASAPAGDTARGAADALSPPTPQPAREAPAPATAPTTSGGPSWGDPDAAPPSAVGAPESPPARPRGWRFPRETVRRPLTLPQGVMRFDSTLSFGVLGSQFFMVGYAGLAAGLFDDLEIGAVPLGLTFVPLNFRFSDPSLYARVRVLSGDVQIAFRAGTTLPVAGQFPAAQMDLGAELAWRIVPSFRIDTGVDYGALFASTFNQRIGIPLSATLQLGIQAIGLVTGLYVFNDFDDVDVPLMLRYVVSLPGYQGPLGELSVQGGFTDLEHADAAWTVLSRLTFFAYL